MGKLSDLREVLGASADHAERLAKGMGAVDEAARSLNGLAVASQGTTGGAAGAGIAGHFGTPGTDNLGNTIGATPTGGGGGSVQGGAGSGSKSANLNYIAHDNGDGKPSPRGPVANISGIVLGGVFHAGIRPPITDGSGALLDILDAQGNSLLALLHSQGGGEQSAGGAAAGGGGGATKTFDVPSGGPRGSFPSTPGATTPSTPGGGSSGGGTVSAGDRAIIAAIGGLREELRLTTPLKTLIGAQH